MQNKIEIEVITKNLKNAISEFDKLNESLKGTNQQIAGLRLGSNSSTLRTISKEGNKILRTTQTFAKDGSLKSISTNVTAATAGLKGMLGTFAKIGLAAVAVKKTTETMKKFAQYSIDYSESLNLFNVVFENIEKNGVTAYSKVGLEATKFQNKLKENFGANPEESLTYQALFQSMAISQGLSDKAAYIMSENSTKLVYDLSSLFNKEQEDVAEALRAGIYAGQTKPLRTYGIDVTETSLQATLEEMQKTNQSLNGLTVAKMNQAEKQMLRYLTVLKQTTKAQGDFANTIESPANLIKTLENNLDRMRTAIGNLLIGPFQKLLQLANAVVIVITETANAIASLFGIKVSDYNTGIASVEDMYEDQADAIDDATEAAAKYKRQLLSFDEVHNINESTDNGSSTNAGINQALIDSLKGYDNGLNKVKLKAQKIADTILKWLGFVKKIDPLTGEVSYKMEGLAKAIVDLVTPLLDVAINDVLPAFLNLLSGALTLLGKVIKDVRPIFEWFFKSVVNPLIKFAGSILADVLNAIGDALKWIADNEIAVTLLEGIVTTFGLLGIILGTTNAVIGIYNGLAAIAAVVTGTFGAALAILTSPITLVLAAIALLVAGIILLIKHWDKVKEVAQNCWNKIKEVWQPVKKWFEDNVTKPIENLFNNLWDAIPEGAQNVLKGIKNVFSTVKNSLTDSATSFLGPIGQAINSLSNIKIGSSKSTNNNSAFRYATGGFPEEGPFYMNRGEIAGKFSNGKGVVANNYQITEGIKQAVMSGMSTALANSGNRDVSLNITMEEGIVVKKAINGINEITRTTGESPLYM